ncbi:type II secretion system protein N [Glycocaulis abyssi]|uniref:Type II secretion system protein N n=1 Tax=Glycocaulis abyssi TaxID=1433403 RepID=A0ABV9N9N0_9PROT
MRRAIVLVIAGLTAFSAAAVALMPASVFHALFLQPRGVQAAQITGTIWSGQWHAVQVRSVRLAHVDGALDAFSLLQGRPALQVEISDPRARGEGRVILGNGSVELHGVSGRILPADLVPLTGPGRAALGEPLMFSDVQARFGARGCETASGAIRFGGLMALDTGGAASLPVLNGQLECAGSLPAIRFAGETADVRIDGHVRFGPETASWSLAATPRTGTIAMVLRSIGFDGSGDVLRSEGQTGWDVR